MNSDENDLAFSSGGDEGLYYSTDDSDAERRADDATGKHYRILNQYDIRKLQETDISTVSSLLSVSKDVACLLLYQKNWDLSSFNDDCFVDDEPAEILRKQKAIKQVCNICFDEFDEENTVSATCGHPFCVVCLKTYITTSINDGPGCLTLRCPEPDCKAFVGLKMVDRLLSGGERDRYYQYLRRSYVEMSRIRKWCPGPGCDFAVELDDNVADRYEVMCNCGHKFCWKCTEESHRPIGCDTVAKWVEKNSSEAENVTWILAYTKPCPKCKQPIEKNQGCNHMTCIRPCEQSFCWICLQPWNSHVYDSCNRYSGVSVDEKKRRNAKEYLERYSHFYERWALNDKSRKKAVIDLNRARTMLGKMQQGVGVQKLEFVIEAWEQIVECRLVLKWTYAYGYYLWSDKSWKKKMNLFECLQGEAEASLERLHHCAEKEIERYLKAPQQDFKDFNAKLANYTNVTRKYFQNLVRALESNLCEVK